jgi:hypothetical protein
MEFLIIVIALRAFVFLSLRFSYDSRAVPYSKEHELAQYGLTWDMRGSHLQDLRREAAMWPTPIISFVPTAIRRAHPCRGNGAPYSTEADHARRRGGLGSTGKSVPPPAYPAEDDLDPRAYRARMRTAPRVRADCAHHTLSTLPVGLRLRP